MNEMPAHVEVTPSGNLIPHTSVLFLDIHVYTFLLLKTKHKIHTLPLTHYSLNCFYLNKDTMLYYTDTMYSLCHI